MYVRPGYSASSTSPLPSEGLTIDIMDHKGEGHSQGDVTDCEECGQQIAGWLTSLHVGVAGESCCQGCDSYTYTLKVMGNIN
jgi:hypothetical protein